MATTESPAGGVSRRAFLGSATLLPLLGIVPGLLEAAWGAPAGTPYRFFSAHQAKVVDAATRRLVPGPDDDPAETGHPGAAEADVVRYLDTMLAAFSFSPPRLFAGGPWSNRTAPGPDHLAEFVPPDPAQAYAWQHRLAQLHKDYAAGIALLDSEAGGDFAAAPALQQDKVLASDALAGFLPLLFSHTIEGMYSIPEYGGNAGRVGWIEIGYPGDSQPRGYTAAELAEQQISVLDPTGITAQALEAFPRLAPAMVAGRRRHVG